MSIGDKRKLLAGRLRLFTVDEVIAPFKASINHVGGIALPYFAFSVHHFRLQMKR